MIEPEDISSLTDFQRNTRKHLTRLKKTGRAEVLTVNGKAALVVMDAIAYAKLARRIERAETDHRIQNALAEASQGKGRPASEFFEELRQELAAKASSTERRPRRKSA